MKAFGKSEAPIPITQPTAKSSTFIIGYSSASGFPICGDNHTARSPHGLNVVTPSIQRQSLRMKADISACQSQQPSTMICAVTRKSQHANHAVMEIHTIRTSKYDSQGIYTLRSRPRKWQQSKPIQAYIFKPEIVSRV